MLRLAKSGVPWDGADRLNGERLLGFIVAAGEIDGRKFDWDQMDWEPPA